MEMSQTTNSLHDTMGGNIRSELLQTYVQLIVRYFVALKDRFMSAPESNEIFKRVPYTIPDELVDGPVDLPHACHVSFVVAHF